VNAIAQAGRFPFAQEWSWPIRNLLNDVRVRYGIKLGLAGLLALFLTQILRLPDDAWAILTVFVMMLSQYVGSAAVKAITRVLGTIAGAIVGVWLVGNYTSTPMIFLPVLFVVIAFATYKFGQIGPRQAPYAYFVLGVTTLVIATDGIAAPEKAWQLGLYRPEEIVVGIVSALLVSSILWPRYARAEFITSARDALRSVEALLSAQTQDDARGADASAALDKIRQTFAARLGALTNLRQAGARESTLFSARLPQYDAYLVSLTSLFDAALYLAEQPLPDAPIVDRLRKELKQISRAIVEEIRIVSGPGPGGEQLPASSLNAAFADLEQKIAEVREQGFLVEEPMTIGVTFASHTAALRLLRDELNTLRAIRERLLVNREVPGPEPHRKHALKIDWPWIKIGMKGGLAAVIAITLLKWIHPPGAAAIPLMAWLQAINGRAFLRAGGSGDRRAFQNAFLGCLVFTACTVALLALAPLLASYLTMNLVLFFVLFAFGFATAKVSGITFGMQLGFLIVSAFVGLNLQQPVSSQAIIDTFVGLGIGLFVGATVGRLLWPVLPQMVLREDLLAVLADLKALLSEQENREAIPTQLTLRSIEAYQAVRQIPLLGPSHEERERLYSLITEVQALVPRVRRLITLQDDLPQPCEPFLRLPLQRLKSESMELLDAFADRLRTPSRRRDLPAMDGAFAGIDDALRQIRDRRPLASYPVNVPLLMLDIVGRYQAVAHALDKIRRLVANSQIERYWGDYAL